LKEKKFGN